MNEDLIKKQLLQLAYKAYKNNEIPVSAIVVKNNKIVAKSFNKREKSKDITAHAEVLAIKKAARKLKRWNLSDCILYVTLKPCDMCTEIIKQSRIKELYYLLEKPISKHDYKKTTFSILDDKKVSSSYQQLLSSFFQNKR